MSRALNHETPAPLADTTIRGYSLVTRAGKILGGTTAPKASRSVAARKNVTGARRCPKARKNDHMSGSIWGLLAENNIRTRSILPGRNEHVICPKCEGGKEREKSFVVNVDEDGYGFTAVCHRGTCGYKIGKRLPFEGNLFSREKQARLTKKPEPHPIELLVNRPEWLNRFFDDRRIGNKTIADLGVYATSAYFQSAEGHLESIVFPYTFNGEVVNRKYRARDGKKHQRQEKGAQRTLYNIDNADEEVVCWVEGEPDVAAMYECGFHSTVSLPDGASATGYDQNSKRLEPLGTHHTFLAKVKKFVLAGDMDMPGLALREELARRLGRHKCWLVTWPEGCKDACDTLREHGYDVLRRCVEDAEPYPIEGLYKLTIGKLRELRNLPAPETMTTGCVSLDEKLKIPSEGRIIVVTGFPGSGKTTWTRFALMNACQYHDRKIAVFSPETAPWLEFAKDCAEVLTGKKFRGKYYERMTDEELEAAEVWLENRLTMIVADSEDSIPTLDWLFDMFRIAILRDGVTDVLIDPWNEIVHERGDISETEYVGRALQKTRSFAERHGVNVWFVAHPAKPFVRNPQEKQKPPGGYDISSSAHWANKADLGLTVHSEEAGKVSITIWKSRYMRWAKREDMNAPIPLRIDPAIGRFYDPETDGDVMPQAETQVGLFA